MELFNIFKKRKYDFEVLLKKAVANPAYRVEFYKRILTEKLLVINKGSEILDGSYITTADTKVQILTLNNLSIPVFTSTDRIFDKGIIKSQVSFLELNGEVLLKMLTGKTLIINPYSDYCKEILPSETDRILDGTILNENVQHLEIKEETKVLIGQPAKYPEAVIKSFIELFSSKPNVKAAYLGWVHDPASDIPPHYIFAIEETGNWDTLIKELASILNSTLGPEEIVDFLKINGNKELNDYFINDTTPFYKKR